MQYIVPSNHVINANTIYTNHVINADTISTNHVINADTISTNHVINADTISTNHVIHTAIGQCNHAITLDGSTPLNKSTTSSYTAEYCLVLWSQECHFWSPVPNNLLPFCLQ